MKPQFQYADVDKIPWRKSDFAEGISVKDLGSSNGQSIQLVKFDPGASFPRHKHSGPEFIYMLEGEAFQDGNLICRSMIAIAAKDSEESHFHSPKGCTFLLLYTE